MRTLLIIATLFLLASCAKEAPRTLKFDVTASDLTVSVGDTVTFRFLGNADNIVFYSGEAGNNYDYRTRTKAPNRLQLDFTSFVQAGEIYSNLQLLVSDNYSGLGDTTSIKKATWTDVSNRAVFSTGADNTPSGTVDLTDIVEAAKGPISIAFRYTDYPKPRGQNRWYIRSFNLSSISPQGGVTSLATLANAGWQATDFQNTAAVWTISTTRLLIYGGNSAAPDNDDWVIAKSVDATSVAPDKGVAIKNISMNLDEFQHVYMTPGTYKVVFVSSSVWFNSGQQETRELMLTVNP